MLTQCIAVDHGPAGVRANCLCPGWVRTPMADGEMDCACRPERLLARGRLRGSHGRRAAAPAEHARGDRGHRRLAPLGRRVLRQRGRDLPSTEASRPSTSAALAFGDECGERAASPSQESRSRRSTSSAASALRASARSRTSRRSTSSRSARSRAAGSARPTSPLPPPRRRSRPGPRSALPAAPSTCTASRI